MGEPKTGSVAWRSLAIAAVLLAGCSRTGVLGVGVPTYALEVAGTVSDATGARVGGAAVSVTPYSLIGGPRGSGTECGGLPSSGTTTATSAQGAFNAHLAYASTAGAAACVRVIAAPPAGSRFAADTVIRDAVVFDRVSKLEDAAPDTLRLAIVLPAAR